MRSPASGWSSRSSSGCELEGGLWRDLEGFVRARGRGRVAVRPAEVRGCRSGRSGRRRSFSAASIWATFSVSGKIDRIDVDPHSARGIVHDYKSGKTAHSAREDRAGAAAPDSALHARPARPGRDRAARRRVPRAGRGSARRAACSGRTRGRTACPSSTGTTTSTRTRFWAQVDLARERARADRRADPRRRRQARPALRRLSGLVLALVDVPGASRMTVLEQTLARQPNPEQQAAIDARGVVFVSAGAGTGKTMVLVERFAQAVCDEGVDVDSILVITYTERAAGELRGRIRARLAELGRVDLARELDGAWISTIHGLCLRLLKAYPFAAGLDPRFRVLDESQARVLKGEAFETALTEFCARREPDRLKLLATYTARGLRRMLAGVHETLRAAGRPLELELGEGPGLPQRVEELREAARCLVEDANATETVRTQASRVLDLLERAPGADLLLDLARLPGAGRACRVVRGGTHGCRASGAGRAGGARPRSAPGAARALRRRVRRCQAAGVGTRLRRPAARGARPAAGRRGDPAQARRGASGRSWSTSSRTRTGCSAS